MKDNFQTVLMPLVVIETESRRLISRLVIVALCSFQICAVGSLLSLVYL